MNDTGFWEEDFDEIVLGEYDGGFRINNYSVNCYSVQNGYYSNELEVKYFDKDWKKAKSLIAFCDEKYDD